MRGVVLAAVMVLGGLEAGARPSIPQAEDRVQPEIVAPGVLSSGEVFRGSFTPDGQTLYFFKKTVANTEEYRIFSSRLVSDRWTEPVRVDLGGDFSNTYPAIAPDGRRMVFASSRPAPGIPGPPNFYLWDVERTGEGWGTPRFLHVLNLPGHYHSWPEFTPDGTLRFRRTSPDWRTTEPLVSRVRNGSFGTPSVDPVIESCRAVRPDTRIVGGGPMPGGALYVLDVAIPARDGRAGQSDIWIADRDGDTCRNPRPLGPSINSVEFETFPFFSPDARDMYFVRGFKAFYRVPLASVVR
jgi:hypothetical protein